MRGAFEAWASDNWQWPRAIERANDGSYLLAQTASAWTVWQAACAWQINAMAANQTTPEREPTLCTPDRPCQWCLDALEETRKKRNEGK